MGNKRALGVRQEGSILIWGYTSNKNLRTPDLEDQVNIDCMRANTYCGQIIMLFQKQRLCSNAKKLLRANIVVKTSRRSKIYGWQTIFLT